VIVWASPGWIAQTTVSPTWIVFVEGANTYGADRASIVTDAARTVAAATIAIIKVTSATTPVRRAG